MVAKMSLCHEYFHANIDHICTANFGESRAVASRSSLRASRLLSNSTKKPLFFALDELQPVICSSKTGRDALRETVLSAPKKFVPAKHPSSVKTTSRYRDETGGVA